MKIGFTGVDLPEGKFKFKDENLIALEKKDRPKKVSPFFAEFLPDEYVKSDAIAISGEKILDLLILDLEKIETRLSRAQENGEKSLLTKCMANLEREVPLCDVEFSGEEREALKAASPLSLKPVIRIENDGVDANVLISTALEKAGCMFFYTSGPSESHAWIVKKGSDIVECAAKIHTDLARGFIKGDVASFDDYMKCHSFNDCKAKGLVRVVDRDYIIQPAEIIEIRFNV